MDGKSFDNLARTLARGASRRSLLRGMIAGSAAVAGASVLPGGAVRAEAPCRDAGEVCEGLGNVCCSGLTCDESQQPAKCVSGDGGGDDGPGQGPKCRGAGEKCQDNPGQGNKCCDGLICNDPDPGVGVCVAPPGDDDDDEDSDELDDVTTLPSTGTGTARRSASFAGTVAAGAALAASLLLRRGRLFARSTE